MLRPAQPSRMSICQFSSNITGFLCHCCSLSMTSAILLQGIWSFLLPGRLSPDLRMDDYFLSLRSYHICYLLREAFTEQPGITSGALPYFQSLYSILLLIFSLLFPLSILQKCKLHENKVLTWPQNCACCRMHLIDWNNNKIFLLGGHQML